MCQSRSRNHMRRLLTAGSSESGFALTAASKGGLRNSSLRQPRWTGPTSPISRLAAGILRSTSSRGLRRHWAQEYLNCSSNGHAFSFICSATETHSINERHPAAPAVKWDVADKWRSDKVRRPRAVLEPYVKKLTTELAVLNPGLEFTVGGSWRRGAEVIGDIDVLIVNERGSLSPDLLDAGVWL